MSKAPVPVGKVAPFREILPASFCMPQPPRFTFGDFPAEVAKQYYSALQVSPVGIYAGVGLELCDGYTLHCGDDLLVAPDLKIFVKHLQDIPVSREAIYQQRPRRRVSGKAGLVISPGYLFYGHWLADILPRLAVLAAGGESLEQISFPVPADTPAFGLELLHLCGVPKSRIMVYGADEVLQPDALLLPTLIHNGFRYSPLLADAVALFKRGVIKAGYSLTAGDSPQRLFLARTGGTRRLLNRPAIQAMGKKAGFTIIRPETMSLPAQLAMFAGAREIVGEYGSAFHTALFSAPGTIVCGLRGNVGHPGFLQTAMGEVLDQPTGYVFGQTGAGHQPHDYTVPEQHFADCLRTVFHPNANLSARRRMAEPAQQKPVFIPPAPAVLAPPKRRLADFFRKREPAVSTTVAVEPGSLFADLLASERKDGVQT